MSAISLALSMVASLLCIAASLIGVFKWGKRRERRQRVAEDDRIRDLAAEVAARVQDPLVEEMRQMRHQFTEMVKLMRDDRAKLLEGLTGPPRRAQSGW